jgi:hypothetical protein
VNFSSVVLNDVSFVEQNKTNSPTSRHNTERFVRGIEYERAPHGYLLRVRKKEEGRLTIFMPDHHSIACTTSDMQSRQMQWPEQHRARLRIESLSEIPCSQQGAQEEKVNGCTNLRAPNEAVGE